jgi:hypothetical protein
MDVPNLPGTALSKALVLVDFLPGLPPKDVEVKAYTGGTAAEISMTFRALVYIKSYQKAKNSAC